MGFGYMFQPKKIRPLLKRGNGTTAAETIIQDVGHLKGTRKMIFSIGPDNW